MKLATQTGSAAGSVGASVTGIVGGSVAVTHPLDFNFDFDFKRCLASVGERQTKATTTTNKTIFGPSIFGFQCITYFQVGLKFGKIYQYTILRKSLLIIRGEGERAPLEDVSLKNTETKMLFWQHVNCTKITNE